MQAHGYFAVVTTALSLVSRVIARHEARGRSKRMTVRQILSPLACSWISSGTIGALANILVMLHTVLLPDAWQFDKSADLIDKPPP